MAIPHLIPGQVVEVKPLGAAMASTRTSALFKSNDLEVMRLVLLAGRSVPPHSVPGDITIHCLEGVLRVVVEGVDSLLRPGEMLYLEGNARHSVHSVEDASALVTVALVK